MTDQEIITLFLKRQEDAVSALDRKYGDRSRRLAGSITGCREDGEECTSDGELAVWNAVPPEHPQRLGSYFLTIVRRLAFDRYRKNLAQKRGGRNAIAVELDECMACGGDPAEITEQKALAAALQSFLQGLDKDGRTMFMRRYWYGEDIGEIALLFGIRETAVRSKLYRIRQSLKAYLNKEGFR